MILCFCNFVGHSPEHFLLHLALVAALHLVEALEVHVHVDEVPLGVVVPLHDFLVTECERAKARAGTSQQRERGGRSAFQFSSSRDLRESVNAGVLPGSALVRGRE